MPPLMGYGSYSGLAGALDGLSSFLRGRKEDQEAERQRQRQDALDADAAVARRVGMALTKAQLAGAGIREGTMPSATSFQLPGLAGEGMIGAPVTVQDSTRYTDLGSGFYLDRNETPEFKQSQAARVASVTAANRDEANRRLIGQALQSANPAEAVRSLLAAGVSASDAPKLLEAANPSAKAPVPGTEAYYAMKEREAQIGAKYRGGAGGSGGAAGGAGGPIGPTGQPMVDTNELFKYRTDFEKQTATERAIAEGFSRLRGATAKGVQNMTAADDIALLFGYMKMQDPGSAVRETEYATAEKASGVPEQVIQLFNKARDGQKLSPEMRQRFLMTAEQLAKQADSRVRRVVTDNVPLWTKRGIDPTEVVRSAPFSGLLTGREVNMQDELAFAREALRDGEPYAVVARTFRERTGQELPR